jgi:hypothetical protein
MVMDPKTMELVKAAGLQFFVQENDIMQLAIDKQLGGRPYMQPYECELATVSYNTSGQDYIDAEETGTIASKTQTMIPEGEVWVLSKISHRDIEAGVFHVEMKVDGETIFPYLLMESSYFLLEFPKACFCTKYFYTKVYNSDTTTKTYRHLRHWQRYDKILINDFLKSYGVQPIK